MAIYQRWWLQGVSKTAGWQAPGSQLCQRLLYPKTGTSTAHRRTTWAGTMGISVVTRVDKGLAGLALAPSQVLEALPNPEEG